MAVMLLVLGLLQSGYERAQLIFLQTTQVPLPLHHTNMPQTQSHVQALVMRISEAAQSKIEGSLVLLEHSAFDLDNSTQASLTE